MFTRTRSVPVFLECFSSLVRHDGHRFMLSLFTGPVLPTLSPSIEMLLLPEEMCERYDILPYSFRCTSCGMSFTLTTTIRHIDANVRSCRITC